MGLDASTPIHPDQSYFLYSLSNYQTACFVAEGPDGTIMGYIKGNLKEIKDGDVTCKCGSIIGVYVNDEHRKQGVATLLIEELNGLHQSMGAIWSLVRVPKKNNPASKLFNKLGYVSSNKGRSCFDEDDGADGEIYGERKKLEKLLGDGKPFEGSVSGSLKDLHI